MRTDRSSLFFAFAISLLAATSAYAQEPASEPTETPGEPVAPAPSTEAETDTQSVAEPTTGDSGDATAAEDVPGDQATPNAGGTAAEAQDGAAPIGDPAAQEPDVVVRDTFGDWQVRCRRNSDECDMFQVALDNQQNPVAEVSLLKLPEENEADALAVMLTPLGTLLTAGVAVQIDDAAGRQYPFRWCDRMGCFSQIGLTGEMIRRMKRGNSAKITLASVAAPGSPVTLDVSLTGFTAAYDSLSVPPEPTE